MSDKTGDKTGQDNTGLILKIYFTASIALVVFAAGMAVRHFELFPYPQLANAAMAAKDWYENAAHYQRVSPDKHLRPSKVDGDGVTIYKPELTQDGVTLVTGFWDDSQVIKLLDMEGNELHQWRVSFNTYWPEEETPHIPTAKPHDWDTQVHGLVLHENGDVIFNIDDYGTVKLDKCGDLVWRLSHPSHHSVMEDSNGDYWLSGGRILLMQEDESVKKQTKWPLVNRPVWEELVVQVSPDGEILREISILDALYNSNLEALILGHHQITNKWPVGTKDDDVTHLNDAEVLTEEKAALFPMFNAGDILISLRNINMVAVIDGKTELIKWYTVAPQIAQHDPDFSDDGHILLLDNRRWGVGSSRILKINPADNSIETYYGGEEDERFFTGQMGMLQELPNGNLLIASAEEGRAMETTPDGKTVWQYIHRWDDEQVVLITVAQRYPLKYAEFTKQSCEQKEP